MNFLKRLAVMFYVTLVLFLGAFIILFTMHYIEPKGVHQLLELIRIDEKMRIVFGASAAGMLFINYIFYRAFTVTGQRGGTIAFDNPSGRVNVSLAAIEDLIKRVIHTIPEVREIKSRISASRKGLNIRIILTLRAEGSIPELTSRVQEMVKRRVQEAIGLEEPIEVAIFVGKIIPDPHRPSKPPKKEKDPKDTERDIPFQGYRA